MRKILFGVTVIVVFLVINACKKSNSSSNSAKTVQNLTGSYSFTAITANAMGQTIDLYDSLPACERDNIVQLNADLSAKFIDAGTVCVPPSDSTGTWSLSQNTDTLYVAGGASYIKSWDGSTLVLTNSESITGVPVPVTVTSTLKKK